MTKELLYIEIDCPKCPHSFGVSPCTATGTKCKNTPATCKDLANFGTGEIQTLRFAKAASYLPMIPYCVPNLLNVTTSSQRINPGENLGKRERVTCTFFNHPHNDADLDPYVTERTYNPYENGTFWGKLAALYPNMQGYPARKIQGDASLGFADLESSHYIVEKLEIAGDNAGSSISLKDALDYAEGNKTLCPPPSNGLLGSAITPSSSSVTLTPSGVGAQYPLSFDASIGDESVICTRSGDVITFTQRAAYFSDPAEHDEGDVLQVMESFVSQNVSQILTRLLDYTNTPIEYYNQSQWDQQVAIVNSPNLTARIAEPTEVFKLIQDLMKDMALDIHTDVIAKKINMRFLINQTPVMTLDDNVIDKPNARFHHDKRVDLFFMSFGRRNPLEKMDVIKNYPTTIVRQSTNPFSIVNRNPAAISRHQSRWIPSTLRTQASKTAQFIVGRYEIAPRGLSCVIKNSFAPKLGQVVNIKTSVFEDEFGGMPTIPMQVVSLSQGQVNSQMELEEFRSAVLTPESGSDIIVALTDDMLNLNEFATLRDIYNSIYPTAIPADAVIRFEADPGVVFGSSTTSDFAVYFGDWPEIAADNVTVQIVGLTIVGRGGDGSIGIGGDGGPAFYTRYQVELIDCILGGGGGGGGGIISPPLAKFGSGGAGYIVGSGYESGTLMTGGSGDSSDDATIGSSGAGGDLGQPGDPSATATSGGDAGVAIDGVSYCTLTTTTVYGAQIN